MSDTLNVFHLHDILAETWRLQVNVATFNLIVFIDDPARRVWIHERALRIADKHPSRLIILDACNASGEVAVSSSALHLAVGELDANTVAHLTRELSAPDVPNVLWWSPERLIEHDFFAVLLELADRVVVDSSGACNDESVLRRLLCFVQPIKPLQDMAWMRSAPWREMIAQFFDDPDMHEDLASLTALEITSGSTAEALYLAGWLASRLAWTPQDLHTLHTSDGRPIALKLIDEGKKRRVVRAALTTGNSRYVAQLSDDENVVELSVEGAKSKPHWFVPLNNIDNASLIEQGILTNAIDEDFNASLRILRELLA
jgi:hypothetical protein